MKKLFLIITVIAFSIPAFSQKRIARVKTNEDLLNEEYCSGLFRMKQADYFNFLDDSVNTSAMGYLNVMDWLQGRVAGLQVYTTRNNLHIPFMRNQRAGVYVNEVRVDYDYLNMLPITDIAMIKVIKGPFLGGWNGAGGAIAIYTIKGEDADHETAAN